MTREEALRELAVLSPGDTEGNHSRADAVLTELLRALGYDDVVDAWEKVEKWYA